MSASAIIMMCIACVGLWGGAALSLAVMFKHDNMRAKEIMENAADPNAGEVPKED